MYKVQEGRYFLRVAVPGLQDFYLIDTENSICIKLHTCQRCNKSKFGKKHTYLYFAFSDKQQLRYHKIAAG